MKKNDENVFDAFKEYALTKEEAAMVKGGGPQAWCGVHGMTGEQQAGAKDYTCMDSTSYSESGTGGSGNPSNVLCFGNFSKTSETYALLVKAYGSDPCGA
jgi:hypothetical protein